VEFAIDVTTFGSIQFTVSPKPSPNPSCCDVMVRVLPNFRSPATTRLLLSERSRNLGERNTRVANRFELVEGVVLEQVGGDLLVAVPESLQTLRLSGDVANTLLAIHSGVAVDVLGPDVADLIDLGVVADRSTVSRRGLIRAGAVGVGAGIAVLALPSAAAASSGCVALNGLWAAATPFSFLLAEGNQFGIPSPIFPSRPLPDGNPSPLSVDSYGVVPVSAFLDDGELGVVQWQFELGDEPPPPVDILAPDLTIVLEGSFTWGDQCYTVSFAAMNV
jgi:hypothetical protein